MALDPDLIALLQELDAAEVKYLIVGGHALGFHATPRFTKDVDFWLQPGVENLARADLALRRFGAPSAAIHAVRDLQGLDVAWMGNPPLRFDFMIEVPGGDFEAAWARRVNSRWGGAPVCVIAADDLLQLKRASGRPQDLLDAEALEALKALKAKG